MHKTWSLFSFVFFVKNVFYVNVFMSNASFFASTRLEVAIGLGMTSPLPWPNNLLWCLTASSCYKFVLVIFYRKEALKVHIPWQNYIEFILKGKRYRILHLPIQQGYLVHNSQHVSCWDIAFYWLHQFAAPSRCDMLQEFLLFVLIDS